MSIKIIYRYPKTKGSSHGDVSEFLFKTCRLDKQNEDFEPCVWIQSGENVITVPYSMVYSFVEAIQDTEVALEQELEEEPF